MKRDVLHLTRTNMRQFRMDDVDYQKLQEIAKSRKTTVTTLIHSLLKETVTTAIPTVTTPSGESVTTPIEKVKEEEDSLIAVCPECQCEFLLGTKNIMKHGKTAKSPQQYPDEWKGYQ